MPSEAIWPSRPRPNASSRRSQTIQLIAARPAAATVTRAAAENSRPSSSPCRSRAQDHALGDDAGGGGDRGRGDDPSDAEVVERPAPPPPSPPGWRAAIPVGTQGRCRLKKVRVSRRKRPLVGSEKANQKSAVATTSVSCGVEGPALVDQPDHRLGEDQHRRRRRDQDEEDLAHPVGHRRTQVVDLPRVGEAGQGREEDGRDRDREDPLRQLVDAEGFVDRRRRLVRRRGCRRSC